jgi:hypothetical protein
MIELTFRRERETKNTVRYQEDEGGPGAVETIYVRKTALAGLGNPEKLRLTIRPVPTGATERITGVE